MASVTVWGTMRSQRQGFRKGERTSLLGILQECEREHPKIRINSKWQLSGQHTPVSPGLRQERVIKLKRNQLHGGASFKINRIYLHWKELPFKHGTGGI